MNKNMLERLIILGVFFLFIWPVSYWLFILRPSPDAEMHDFVTSDEFLMSLQDKAYDGCVALSYYDEVDIVIVGNSHASANIDPFEFARLAEDKIIAVCALPAWNTDHFPAFFDYLDRYDLKPETIIWLVDDSSVFEFANARRRQDFRDTVFSDQSFRNRVTAEWYSESERFQRLTTERYIRRLNDMSAKLSLLNDDIINQVVSLETLPNYTNQRSAVSSARPIARQSRKLDVFCTSLKDRDIELITVSAPLPSQTRDALKRFMPAGIFETADTGANYLIENAKCIDRVLERPLEAWNLQLKHFVNRTDMADYPYEIWDSVEGFEAPFQELDPRTQLSIYDPDHLNPVGAKLFTQSVWQAIQQERGLSE